MPDTSIKLSIKFLTVALHYFCFIFISNAQEKFGNDTLSLTHSNINGHTKKGNLILGFNSGIGFGVRNEGVSFDNSTVLLDGSFTPKAGLFVKDKFMVGLNYDFSATVAVFNYNSQYALAFNTFGAILRYYHKTGVFLESQLGFGRGREEFILNERITKESFNGNHLTLGLGLANFWDKTVNFEILLKYNRSWGNFQKRGIKNFGLSSLLLTAGIHISIDRSSKKKN